MAALVLGIHMRRRLMRLTMVCRYFMMLSVVLLDSVMCV